MTQQLIFGIHPIRQLMKRGLRFKKAYIQKKITSSLQEELIDYCRKRKINFYFTEKEQLHKMTNFSNHQGFVLECKAGFQKVENLTSYLEKLPPTSHQTVLILDQITDQHNLGAIVRSAYFFGSVLVVLENKNSAPIDFVVHKVSAGASLMIPFYLTPKISQVIAVLKQHQYVILGAVVEGEFDFREIEEKQKHSSGDSPKKYALILGSEGKGIRPHLLREVDKKVSIPGVNSFNSLNVSVASGIVLHELSKNG